MAEKLTAKFVGTLPAPGRGQKIYFDTEIKGFGVRVLASGVKSFVLDYWNAEGTQRRLTIGQFPTWTVARARERAKELRIEIDADGDPLDTRKKLRTAPTVAKLCERYIDEHLPEKAEKSQHEDRRIIDRDILPRLGKRKVADVHNQDIKALHRAITKRGSPVQANRTVALLSTMFNLAMIPREGENEPWRLPTAGNPCRKIKKTEHGRERFYSEAELSRIAAALETYSGRPVANMLRLVML